MKNLTILFCIIFSFIFVKSNGNRVWVYAPGEYTIGSDSACEEHWIEIGRYLKMYNEINFTNKGWIPSPKTVKR